ncbi:hypothetical protein TVAG_419550 [Trichomonas vaginalis G3]|uniref:Eukaryotic initiation factor 4E family protein n=1 Tax=Trichomonas vaginalis (strain ATCC PRA-98 / G3) TaxID=412133 RepID=A2EIS9_TRIV3|nr:RNA Cap, translation initiation factor Eif4e domain-containing protein [Trichomonas vaginalis G3]EAY07413.1 hypothetical protein TVAG_419550 [Trichomonas vaginalis G3]KAI5484623.1 RNA Cap, translation initiation factor Eif4e domain-containing protein [Trichomonas vaginalis G3]|eukprot:XP_001319636.1 hypothetical protein [Trichomonas vaginalis G3]
MTKKKKSINPHGSDFESGWTIWSSVPPIKHPSVPFESAEEEDFDEESLKATQVSLSMKEIGTVLDYEGFWELMTSLEQPSSIQGRGTYLILREGMIPFDTSNQKPLYSKFIVNSQCLCDSSPESLEFEARFYHIALGIMSNQLHNFKSVVCIAFISTRENSLIELWINPTEKENLSTLRAKIQKIAGKHTQLQEKPK